VVCNRSTLGVGASKERSPVGYHQSERYSLESLLREALRLRSVPSDIEPPIDGDEPLLESERFGDRSAEKKMVLIGDSHMRQWYPAFDSIGLNFSYDVHLLWTPLCPPVAFDTSRQERECTERQTTYLDQIESILINDRRESHQTSAQLLVLMSHSYRSPASIDFRDPERVKVAYTEFFNQMKARIWWREVTPIILGDSPTCDLDNADCLALHLNEVQKCSCPLNESRVEFWIETEKTAAKVNQVAYVDIEDLFCVDSSCPPIVQGLRVLRDSNHVSYPYANFLAPYLVSKLISANVTLS